MSSLQKLLDQVPDCTDWGAAQKWLEEGKNIASKFSAKDVKEGFVTSMEWGQIQTHSVEKNPFGLYPIQNWRKFVLATFLADLVSYSAPVDQVSFDRLLFVMHAFPQGFRVWWLNQPGGHDWPIGYSGWFPMREMFFDVFEKDPGKLRDRFVIPDVASVTRNPFIYLFNYSVIPFFKKTSLSKALMKQYAHDVISHKPAGLACITVSEDGARVASRFGMTFSGHLEIGSSKEGVYTGRRITLPR